MESIPPNLVRVPGEKKRIPGREQSSLPGGVGDNGYDEDGVEHRYLGGGESQDNLLTVSGT